MVSSDTLVVGALSGGHELGLALVGAAFIAFALVSSFVLPRRNPNFPGRGMGWYVTLCVLFFIAMMAAVLVLGKETKEATGNESPAHTETRSGSLPGQGPTTTSGGAGGGAPTTKGDPAAGKAVFASAGCASCHTLKAANAHGTIGPNLDQLKPAEDAIRNQVIHGGGPMPAFKGTLSAKQIDDVSAYVFASTHA